MLAEGLQEKYSRQKLLSNYLELALLWKSWAGEFDQPQNLLVFVGKLHSPRGSVKTQYLSMSNSSNTLYCSLALVQEIWKWQFVLCFLLISWLLYTLPAMAQVTLNILLPAPINNYLTSTVSIKGLIISKGLFTKCKTSSNFPHGFFAQFIWIVKHFQRKCVWV